MTLAMTIHIKYSSVIELGDGYEVEVNTAVI